MARHYLKKTKNKTKTMLSMITNAYNLKIQEVEAKGSSLRQKLS